MSLSESDVRKFREEGYLVVPDFFDAREVSAMRADLDRLQREGKFNNVSTEGDGATPSQSRANLQICPLHPHSDLFRALPFHEKVFETVPRLIGDPIVLHLDQVFLKPARHGMGTSWHQDNAYFGMKDPLRGTAMWIAVHDATVANGTIEVIPGMAREKLEHGRDPNSNHHIRCWPDESKAVPVELPAGGVVFFCYGTPHCTRANNTDHDRAGVAYHFIAEEIYSQGKGWIGTVLDGPNATGGEKEYQTRVAGTWDQEVEKALSEQAGARVQGL